MSWTTRTQVGELSDSQLEARKIVLGKMVRDCPRWRPLRTWRLANQRADVMDEIAERKRPRPRGPSPFGERSQDP